jgi:hypothetical protein
MFPVQSKIQHTFMSSARWLINHGSHLHDNDVNHHQRVHQVMLIRRHSFHQVMLFIIIIIIVTPSSSSSSSSSPSSSSPSSSSSSLHHHHRRRTLLQTHLNPSSTHLLAGQLSPRKVRHACIEAPRGQIHVRVEEIEHLLLLQMLRHLPLIRLHAHTHTHTHVLGAEHLSAVCTLAQCGRTADSCEKSMAADNQLDKSHAAVTLHTPGRVVRSTDNHDNDDADQHDNNNNNNEEEEEEEEQRALTQRKQGRRVLLVVFNRCTPLTPPRRTQFRGRRTGPGSRSHSHFHFLSPCLASIAGSTRRL